MTDTDVRVLVGCVAATAALSICASAQAPRPLSLVSLAEIPRVLDPQLSPDGRTVVYVLNQADWKANRQIGHVWRRRVGEGEAVQLTSGPVGQSSPRWSPDGNSILYLAPESGLQVHLLPASGGDGHTLTSHPTSVSQPAWSADGSSVYFLAADPVSSGQRERDRLRDDVFALDEGVAQRHLWRVRAADGEEEKITSGAFSVTSYRVSRDGRRMTLHRAPSPRPDDSPLSEVWLMDADGGGARQLTDNRIEEFEAQLSPDNERVLFLAEANAQFEPYHVSALFVVPAAGGTPRLVAPAFIHAVEHAAWAPDGRSIFAVVNMGLHSEIYQFVETADGWDAHSLTDGQHSVQFWSMVPKASRMIFQLDEPSRPGDAWILESGGGMPTRVTSVYDRLASEFQLPRQERLVWTSSDGTSVEGLLFYPIDYEPGRRYPLIVQLHGGPSESDKFGFGPGVIVNYVPVLTARGFAVFRPNYRGSSGYGDGFLRDVVDGYFRNMHLDVLTGVDALIARGLADPDRLAVMGWSAGAHLTNWLIGETDRFKAASSTAGAANWVSFFGQTDARVDRELWFGGSPWQADAPIERLWSQSPVSRAAAIRTPTLFLAGEQDGRVPLAQSIEMFRALHANGVPTRLLVAPREGHQWVELRHQVYKANAELEWFERYLRGRDHQWESPPGDGP